MLAVVLVVTIAAMLVFTLPLAFLFGSVFRLKDVLWLPHLLNVGLAWIVVAWAWVYLLGGTIETVKIFLTVTWLIAASAALWRARLHKWHWGIKDIKLRIVLPGLVLACTSCLFYLVPRTFEGQITQRQQMGPDAIGYANATAGMLEDGSFEDLKETAINSAGVRSVEELFDQAERRVYSIPEKSLSIKTEFLIGSLRIGFSGVTASVVDVLGLSKLLTVMYCIAGLFVFLGGMLTFELLRSFELGTTKSLLVAVISSINISLLVGIHEGGLAQSVAYASVALYVTASLRQGLSESNRVMMYVTAGIHVLTSYVDVFFVLVGLSLVWLLISIVGKDQFSAHRARKSLFGLGLSALMVLPLTFKLPSFLTRRVSDARQGGWNWDSWTELGGILGIHDPYTNSPDSIVVQLIVIGLGVSLFRVLSHSDDRKKSVFLLLFAKALSVLSLVVYGYTRYVMGHSTYQWFKFVGSLIGPMSLPLLVLILLQSSQPMLKGKWTIRLLALAITVLSVTISFNYARSFFSESKFLSHQRVSALSDTLLRGQVNQYQLFGRYEWEELALTPFWSGAFINREDSGVAPKPRLSKPVGLLVHGFNCPNWECLNNVEESKKIAIGTDLVIIDLNLTGSDIQGLTNYRRWVVVNRALAEIGAPSIQEDWETWSTKSRSKG